LGVLELIGLLQAKTTTEFLFNPQSTMQRDYGKLLKTWISDHKLPPFEWSILRPTMATLYYARTGDIQSVQRLLQHRQLITTMAYLEEKTVVPMHQKILAEAQKAYFRRIMQ
jgi:site-specific recombinase XerD